QRAAAGGAAEPALPAAVREDVLPRAVAESRLMVETTAQLPTAAAGRPRGVLAFNLFTAIALGIGGFFLGAYLGGQLAVGKDYLLGTDQNDVGVFMGFLFASIGWLAGLGFFNYPLARLAGRPATLPPEETRGAPRSFRP